MSHLILQARTEDQVIVGNLPAARHQDIFGLPFDGNHLACHHGDAGVQRQLGQVPAAVCMTAGSEEGRAESETKASVLTAHHYNQLCFILKGLTQINFDHPEFSSGFHHIASEETLASFGWEVELFIVMCIYFLFLSFRITKPTGAEFKWLK